MQDFFGNLEKTQAQITQKLPTQVEFSCRIFFQTIHFLLSCHYANNIDAMHVLPLMFRV